tara:strand:+ start:104 stop:331 length:228 start_codon:yes stop_codon:yes gene_type:complete
VANSFFSNDVRACRRRRRRWSRRRRMRVSGSQNVMIVRGGARERTHHQQLRHSLVKLLCALDNLGVRGHYDWEDG